MLWCSTGHSSCSSRRRHQAQLRPGLQPRQQPQQQLQQPFSSRAPSARHLSGRHCLPTSKQQRPLHLRQDSVQRWQRKDCCKLLIYTCREEQGADLHIDLFSCIQCVEWPCVAFLPSCARFSCSLIEAPNNLSTLVKTAKQALRVRWGLDHAQGNGGTPKAAGNPQQASWPFPQFSSGNNFGAAQSFLPQQQAGAPAQQQVGSQKHCCLPQHTSLKLCSQCNNIARHC